MQADAYDHAQAEASLEKLRFLQRLDHELKNPLTAMQIALANLEDTTEPDRRREIRASMQGQLRRMSYLVGDLRKLASLEKGVMEKTPVEVRELLDEVATTFTDTADLRHFIHEFAAAQLPNIIGDRDLLQLAVYNLLDNAHKFTQTGDTITLRASVEHDWLTIQVTDTGRGIPPADLAHVWEDLYRSADVQGISGSGVGLAMVKGIIEQHGGRVMISSAYGQYTTVTLRIPLPKNEVT